MRLYLVLIGVEQYERALCVKNELVRPTVAVFNADLTLNFVQEMAQNTPPLS